MSRARELMLSALIGGSLAGCSGCGSQSASAPDANSVTNGAPDTAVFEFLKAVQTGDDAKAALMLTKLAREKTAEMEMVVAPPGSETASFEVGEVQFLENNAGAYVSSTWTDVGEEGKPHSDQIVWVVRNEPEGWRIAGMVTKLFDSKLVLNFEDPQDMMRKQQLAEQEMMRRAQQQIQSQIAPQQQQEIQEAKQPQDGKTLR